MKELKGKVAVVTGAASGIGRALAQALVAQGMKVVLADVEQAPLDAVARELADAGGEVLAVPTDVTQRGDQDALARRTLDDFGAVHLLCNNAGVLLGGRTWEAPVADFQWVMDVNFWGVLHGIQAFVPILIEQGSEAHVVNTSSMAGLVTMPFVSAYHASKHAVLALSECLYKELQAEGAPIGVSVLCPEMINTKIGTAERNRPSDPSRDPDHERSEIANLISDAVIAQAKQGLDPTVIAARVIEAVREDRFYILSEESWRDACHARLDDIRAARNPRLDTLQV